MTRDGEEADLLDAQAVAKRLACGTRSVWRWVEEGRMPAPIQLGRLRRWRTVDIDAWVKGGCQSLESR